MARKKEEKFLEPLDNTEQSEETVSQQNFSMLTGLSKSKIFRMVHAKKLPVNEDGKILLNKALEVVEEQKRDNNEPKRRKRGEKVAGVDSKRAPAVLIAAKAAKERAKAELAVLELKQKEGELISYAEVRNFFTEALGVVKITLNDLPKSFSLLLEGKTAREIEGILEKKVLEVIERLNQYEFELNKDSEGTSDKHI